MDFTNHYHFSQKSVMMTNYLKSNSEKMSILHSPLRPDSSKTFPSMWNTFTTHVVFISKHILQKHFISKLYDFFASKDQNLTTIFVLKIQVSLYFYIHKTLCSIYYEKSQNLDISLTRKCFLITLSNEKNN